MATTTPTSTTTRRNMAESMTCTSRPPATPPRILAPAITGTSCHSTLARESEEQGGGEVDDEGERLLEGVYPTERLRAEQAKHREQHDAKACAKESAIHRHHQNRHQEDRGAVDRSRRR